MLATMRSRLLLACGVGDRRAVRRRDGSRAVLTAGVEPHLGSRKRANKAPKIIHLRDALAAALCETVLARNVATMVNSMDERKALIG